MWFWQKKYYFDFHHFYFSTKFTSFTTFIMSWLREFFFFIFLLLSLRHSQKQIIIIWLLLPWPRVKKFFFSFSHYVQPWSQEKNFDFYCTTALTTLRSWKKCSLLFHWDVHYGNVFLHDVTSTYFTHTSLTCRKNFQMIYSPEKNMCNLKNFLSLEFQWSLTWFTSQKSVRQHFYHIFHYFDGNWAEKRLSYCYVKSWDCLLTHWLLTTNILFYRDTLPQPIQSQLVKKEKTSQFCCGIFEICIKFQTIWKKGDTHSLCISEIRNCEKGGYLNA